MTDILIALAMFAALALIGTGAWMLAKGIGTRLKAGLMIGAGVVTMFNVWVSTVPL